MGYDPMAVANCFLDLAERDEKLLSPMKIQKLVYYAHGWSLALNGVPLIDSTVQAWDYGPVIPELYRELKSFGSQPIRERIQRLVRVPGKPMTFRAETPSIDDCPDERANAQAKSVIEAVWDVYGDLTAVQLSNFTHVDGSPWSEVRASYPGRNRAIPDDLIKQYFERTPPVPEAA